MSSPKLNPVTVEFPIQLRLTDGIPIPIQEVKIEISGPQNVNGQLLRAEGAVGSVGSARVKFVTETAGAYSVSLTTKGEHLLYSPLTINVTPKTNNKEPTEPPPTLPPLPKQNVVFEVDARNSNGDIITNEEMDLSIEVEGPEQVTPSVERVGDILRITFEVEAARGTYEIAVFQNGVPIQRSPFTVELGRASVNSDKKDNNVARLPALPSSRTIQFRVPAQSADGKEIKAKDTTGRVTTGQEEDGSVKIVDNGKELLISFEAFHPGPFEITVERITDRKPLLGSPFDVDVPPEAFSNRRCS